MRDATLQRANWRCLIIWIVFDAQCTVRRPRRRRHTARKMATDGASQGSCATGADQKKDERDIFDYIRAPKNFDVDADDGKYENSHPYVRNPATGAICRMEIKGGTNMQKCIETVPPQMMIPDAIDPGYAYQIVGQDVVLDTRMFDMDDSGALSSLSMLMIVSHTESKRAYKFVRQWVNRTSWPEFATNTRMPKKLQETYFYCSALWPWRKMRQHFERHEEMGTSEFAQRMLVCAKCDKRITDMNAKFIHPHRTERVEKFAPLLTEEGRARYDLIDKFPLRQQYRSQCGGSLRPAGFFLQLPDDMQTLGLTDSVKCIVLRSFCNPAPLIHAMGWDAELYTDNEFIRRVFYSGDKVVYRSQTESNSQLHRIKFALLANGCEDITNIMMGCRNPAVLKDYSAVLESEQLQRANCIVFRPGAGDVPHQNRTFIFDADSLAMAHFIAQNANAFQIAPFLHMDHKHGPLRLESLAVHGKPLCAMYNYGTASSHFAQDIFVCGGTTRVLEPDSTLSGPFVPPTADDETRMQHSVFPRTSTHTIVLVGPWSSYQLRCLQMMGVFDDMRSASTTVTWVSNPLVYSGSLYESGIFPAMCDPELGFKNVCDKLAPPKLSATARWKEGLWDAMHCGQPFSLQSLQCTSRAYIKSYISLERNNGQLYLFDGVYAAHALAVLLYCCDNYPVLSASRTVQQVCYTHRACNIFKYV